MEREIKSLKFNRSIHLQELEDFIKEGKTYGANILKFKLSSDPNWDDDRLVLIKVLSRKEELDERLLTLNEQLEVVKQEIQELI